MTQREREWGKEWKERKRVACVDSNYFKHKYTHKCTKGAEVGNGMNLRVRLLK